MLFLNDPYFEHHVLDGVGNIFSRVGKVKAGLIVIVHVGSSFGEFIGFGVAIDVCLFATSVYVALFFFLRVVSVSASSSRWAGTHLRMNMVSFV